MYNFETLSPRDFEILTGDLIQRELSITLESFKSGKDAGIDLRYAQRTENKVIVQCKHYKSSSIKDLLNSLRKEVLKIAKLSPEQYIISTSLPLSPADKEKIASVCAPFIKSFSDIYGKEDLNNLLRKFPEIEEKHFKLWLSSTTILKRIINSDIMHESYFKLEEIQDKIKKFVPNPSLLKAQKILNEENFVVISGAPGVGKSTLAEMLIWDLIATQQYEFVNISDNIRDAYKMYNKDPNVKQIFYYDDFLGETHLSKNEDSDLILFINRINRSKNKKLILTTREYILQQTKLLKEKIDRFVFKKCVIDLKDYTNRIKADILYSHLYFSDLPEDYIQALLRNEKYLLIVKHKNYNPRIIEFMTRLKIHEYVSSENYYDEFIKNLDNPSKIWNHAFENQIDNKTRSVLFAILFQDSHYFDTDVDVLKDIAKKICQKLYLEDFTELDFKKCLKILDGDFISINKNRILFSNPSVNDFLENYISDNNLISVFIELARTKKQFSWIYYTYINIENFDKDLAKQLFEKVRIYNSKWQLPVTTDILFNIIQKLEDYSLLNTLEKELDYIINDLNINIYESFLDTISSPFFQNNNMIREFQINLLEIFVNNFENHIYIDNYSALLDFLEKIDGDWVEVYYTKIKNYIIENFYNFIDTTIFVSDNDFDFLTEEKIIFEDIIKKFDLDVKLDALDYEIERAIPYDDGENIDEEIQRIRYEIIEEEDIRDLFSTLKE